MDLRKKASVGVTATWPAALPEAQQDVVADVLNLSMQKNGVQSQQQQQIQTEQQSILDSASANSNGSLRNETKLISLNNLQTLDQLIIGSLNDKDGKDADRLHVVGRYLEQGIEPVCVIGPSKRISAIVKGKTLPPETASTLLEALRRAHAWKRIAESLPVDKRDANEDASADNNGLAVKQEKSDQRTAASDEDVAPIAQTRHPPTPPTSSSNPTTEPTSGEGSPRFGTASPPPLPPSLVNNPYSRQDLRCKVCGDWASGRHYGINSCEGCKGFFKRSIRQGINYQCRRQSDDCVINRRLRNQCQACRLQHCLNAGMRPWCVQSERPVDKKGDEKQPGKQTSFVKVKEERRGDAFPNGAMPVNFELPIPDAATPSAQQRLMQMLASSASTRRNSSPSASTSSKSETDRDRAPTLNGTSSTDEATASLEALRQSVEGRGLPEYVLTAMAASMQEAYGASSLHDLIARAAGGGSNVVAHDGAAEHALPSDVEQSHDHYDHRARANSNCVSEKTRQELKRKLVNANVGGAESKRRGSLPADARFEQKQRRMDALMRIFDTDKRASPVSSMASSCSADAPSSTDGGRELRPDQCRLCFSNKSIDLNGNGDHGESVNGHTDTAMSDFLRSPLASPSIPETPSPSGKVVIVTERLVSQKVLLLLADSFKAFNRCVDKMSIAVPLLNGVLEHAECRVKLLKACWAQMFTLRCMLVSHERGDDTDVQNCTMPAVLQYIVDAAATAFPASSSRTLSIVSNLVDALPRWSDMAMGTTFNRTTVLKLCFMICVIQALPYALEDGADWASRPCVCAAVERLEMVVWRMAKEEGVDALVGVTMGKLGRIEAKCVEQAMLAPHLCGADNRLISIDELFEAFCMSRSNLSGAA